MPDKKISEARFTDKQGRTIFVQPQGTRLREGGVYYYAPTHEGHLNCPECEASVGLREGSPSTSGSSVRGKQSYFSLSAGGKHDLSCSLPHRKTYKRPQIDRSKGFRIHINTLEFSELFNRPAGVYHLENGRIKIADPDLRDREVLTVHSARDIVKLLERGNYDRIKDSVVIFRNQKLAWEDFLVRPEPGKGHPRFVSLLNRIQGLEKGEETFCLMEVEASRGKAATFKDRKITFEKMFFMRRDGVNETIAPSVFVKNVHDSYVDDMFIGKGRYFVLGVPRVQTESYPDGLVHYLSMTVDNREAGVKINLEDILEKGRARQHRRGGQLEASHNEPKARHG